MYKAVLFDFDGVLTIDPTGSYSICNYISRFTGVDYNLFKTEYLKYNYKLLYGELTHEDVWDDICKAINYDINYEVLKDSFINTPIDNDMLELAEKLKKFGFFTGIVTDNKKDRIDDIANHFGFKNIFDGIAISAEVGSGKEEKVIFNSIMKKLSIEAHECIFIDNSIKNLVIPKEMGMKVIYYDHKLREFNGLIGELKQVGICNSCYFIDI